RSLHADAEDPPQSGPAWDHLGTMFEDRTYKRTFYSAPQSVTSLVAAFLEPAITVLTLAAANAWVGVSMGRPELTLCLLVFALTFPGRNRFRENLLAGAVDLTVSWVTLLVILALCGYATSSLRYFASDALTIWGIATPILQWTAVWIGSRVVKYHAAKPEARRSAVVVGAGPLGVKVSRALNASHELGVDFIGYFDDRTDDRLDQAAITQRLGGLKDVSEHVMRHGIREVYITLPLGSQPRIVELLEQLQGTTASLFFVPDVFGISIIQGRLQDINGVPVVGICETPFTGTNELVKRVSDIILA